MDAGSKQPIDVCSNTYPPHLPLINVKALVEPSEVGIFPKMILWYNVHANNQDCKKTQLNAVGGRLYVFWEKKKLKGKNLMTQI